MRKRRSQLTHNCDALITGLSPKHLTSLELLAHSAQLEHHERPAQPAAALLAIENWALVFKPNQQRRQPNKRGR